MVSCQEAHPDFCSVVTWSNVAWRLVWGPLLAQSIIFALMPALHRLWVRNSRTSLVRLARRYVGSVDQKEIRHPALLNSCFLLELFLSAWFTFSWASRTYSHYVSAAGHVAEQVFCAFFAFTYLLNAARNQFSLKYVFSPGPIITIVTVVPTFIRASDDPSAWMSFGYLRIFNALVAYEKIENTGVLRDCSDMHRGYIITTLRTLALVIILGGTIFVMEVLGDPDAIKDRYVTTEMGDLSFAMMIYWIFTTISTVGYGDFSPTTVLSRMFIIGAIVVGVCFFSTELANLLELHKLESSGKGRYKPYCGSEHVVLIGGGVREYSSVIKSFLDELFRYEHGKSSPGWPNLSFMSSVEQVSELKDAISQLPKHAQLRTNYFMGDPMNPSDTERIRMGEASLVIVIANLQATNMDEEDQNNILRALAVKLSYPQVNLRLMLLRPANRAKAIRSGIRPQRCFSINELKSSLFGISCSCRGWSTMITHFLIAEDRNEDEEPEEVPTDLEDWVLDFKRGRDFQVCGFSIGERFVKTKFLEFAKEAAAYGVMPIAAQIEAKITLNPMHYSLQAGDVLFALAPSPAALAPFQDPNHDWRHDFLEAQSNAPSTTRPSRIEDSNEVVATPASHAVIPGQPAKTPVKSRPSPRQRVLPWAPPQRSQAASSGARGASRLRKAAASAQEHAVDDDEIQLLELQAQRFARTGGHYIVVVLAGEPWQQVSIFIRALRGEHLPFHIPIIVLAPAPAPPPEIVVKIFCDFPRVALMCISEQASIPDLDHAGMMKARCIALFAGNAGQANTGDSRMLDGAGIVTLTSIEWALAERGSTGIPIILEIFQQESVKFLHRVPLYEQKSREHQDSRDQRPRQSEDSVCTHTQPSTFAKTKKKVERKEAFTSHPRFASGGIFTASCLGALVARAYFTPGIVELVEALLTGTTTGQTSFPWQVTLPEELVEKTYGDLTQALLGPKWQALCLGLFRQCDKDIGAGSWYVVTNPRPSTKLRREDLVIVLGTVDFARQCFQQGLLPGAHGAPRAEEAEEPDSALLTPKGTVLACDIPPEPPLPSLPHVQRELDDVRRLLAESLTREAGLKAQLHAAQALPASQSAPPGKRAFDPQPAAAAAQSAASAAAQPCPPPRPQTVNGGRPMDNCLK